jgi:hypothetical protein
MEECDPNAERSFMYGHLLKEKKKAGVPLSLDCCFKKAHNMPSASTSSQN